jgi:hypothetical protein
MNEMNWTEMNEATKKSQSYKKVENYVKELLRREDFNNDINNIRKRISIKITKEQRNNQDYRRKNRRKIGNKLDELMKKYSLKKYSWYETIEHYIYHNEYQEFDSRVHQGLIYAEDMKVETEQYNATIYDERINEDTVKKLFEESYLFEDNELYPVILRISPWATKRDILDYVKNNYSSFIQKIQMRYRIGVNIGATRSKSEFIQERNDFIWENRALPRKDIMNLLYKKYKDKKDFDIDEANISKIISLRKKKNDIFE